MATLHEDLHAFLLVEEIGWGIPSQTYNHARNPLWCYHHPARHTANTTLTDPRQLKSHCCHSEWSNSTKRIRIMLCIRFITCCVLLPSAGLAIGQSPVQPNVLEINSFNMNSEVQQVMTAKEGSHKLSSHMKKFQPCVVAPGMLLVLSFTKIVELVVSLIAFCSWIREGQMDTNTLTAWYWGLMTRKSLKNYSKFCRFM
jgi:hypothetical protein